MGMICKGIAKLAEECGEVVQICGKVIQVGSVENKHWSGDLKVKLEEEIADVLAAARFVRKRCGLDRDKIKSGQKKSMKNSANGN